MLTLEAIAKRHNEWLRIARYVGASENSVMDIVQDMYMKLAEMNEREGNLNRITNLSGGINTVYVFKLLTNEAIKHAKRASKIVAMPENTEIVGGGLTISEEAYSEFVCAVSNSIAQMHEYDRMLLELHFVNGLSMRKIEAKTGIPTHSIFNTLKNAKNKIKQKAITQYGEYRDSRNNTEASYWLGGCDSDDNESDWD